jgi:hypothetical protein
VTDETRYHEDQDPEDWNDLTGPCYCDDCHQAREAWYGTDPVTRLLSPRQARLPTGRAATAARRPPTE